MTSQNHSSRKHAYLSASSANQWLNCPPSIKASEGIGDKTTTFAEEGTFAHELSELYFVRLYDGMTEDKFQQELERYKQNEYYSEELREYVEQYVDIVEEKVNEARAQDEPILFFEHRLDLTRYVPESFGTGDVIIYYNGTVEIVDLKFGKGVEVSALNNPQLRLYGLGAYELLKDFEDVHTIKTTIIQPRLHNVSSESMTADDLVSWGLNVVRPQALKAIEGKGEFKPGNHCRFCKIRHSCRARAEANLNASKELTTPTTLTDDELAELLHKLPDIKRWASDVEEYCREQALENNRNFDGWKVVEGRASRKYVDNEQVFERLKEHYDPNEISETKVLSIPKLEKQIGKKKVAELLSDLVEKPQGKPTLVTEDDKRQPITDSAESDFTEFINK
ncbi:DUF2800 domain-containing protein [Staphylococcus nepalensis]|uniref:DUF2800 domain-containing protein n=1 Tax=Staphylococcus nepalensis TaxID=214473 RepID=UPI000E01FBA8|nr:DUF2800 domain-containing protein [Staphylococcus nepalensis]SUM66727.1 PD-(D/E)XK nuclease superfamily protein [Staphylococcus nepalensis]SUM94665.1 PD-(D/E)XK nuclease superfamily protein [Staphylococcus nepalensis]